MIVQVRLEVLLRVETGLPGVSEQYIMNLSLSLSLVQCTSNQLSIVNKSRKFNKFWILYPAVATEWAWLSLAHTRARDLLEFRLLAVADTVGFLGNGKSEYQSQDYNQKVIHLIFYFPEVVLASALALLRTKEGEERGMALNNLGPPFFFSPPSKISWQHDDLAELRIH